MGRYIADYREEVLLSCIVQDWCAQYVTFPLLILLYTNSVCQDVEQHQINSITAKTYTSEDHVIILTFWPQNVKWGCYMIIIRDIIASIVIYALQLSLL